MGANPDGDREVCIRVCAEAVESSDSMWDADIRRAARASERLTCRRLRVSNGLHAELWNFIALCVLLLSQPLNATMHSVQQNARQVIATPTFMNIMTSS